MDLKTFLLPTTLANLAKRGYAPPANLHELVAERRKYHLALEEAHKASGTVAARAQIKQISQTLEGISSQLQAILDLVPNTLHESVPDGTTANDNRQIMEHTFTIYPKGRAHWEHPDLGATFGAELAHSRFNVLTGSLARAHRKLIHRAMEYYSTHGYDEVTVPALVNQDAIYATGQYPKFADEVFVTDSKKPLYLIPTGEVPVTNLFANKTFNADSATQAYVTHTPCFRKEAGAAGRDTRGLIRQHQFDKVELVRACRPEDGLNTLELMLLHIITFIRQFKVNYRVVELCAGDIGFAGHKAYDIEMWFANSQQYREIASITWCSDFQAKRMGARYHDRTTKGYIHTLNGTGLAAGRVLAALVEAGYDLDTL